MLTEATGNNFLNRLKNVFATTERSNFDETSTDLLTSNETYPADTTSSNNETTATELPVEENLIDKEISLRTVQVTAPNVTLPNEKDLDIRFATMFTQAGGKFIFAETINDAVEILKGLKKEEDWSHVFFWENEIRDAFANSNFQKGAIGFTIENSDAAVSLCETLIADDGTILLNPKQASRRRLPCFPKAHIIFTDISRLAGSETEGLEKFYRRHKGELPSIIKLGSCNKGHFYDKQRLILNAEGTENVYVFMIDEIIPHSLRP